MSPDLPETDISAIAIIALYMGANVLVNPPFHIKQDVHLICIIYYAIFFITY